MSRHRKLSERYQIRLAPEQAALVQYYSRRYGREVSDIIGTIVNQYALADADFDGKDFKRFVDRRMKKHYEDDPELLSELKTRVAQLLKS